MFYPLLGEQLESLIRQNGIHSVLECIENYCQDREPAEHWERIKVRVGLAKDIAETCLSNPTQE